MDPSDPTRCENFWIDTLKMCYPQGLNNIDPYHQFLLFWFYQFPPNLRNMFVLFLFNFFLEFIICRLFLFPISPLVWQFTILSPLDLFFQCLPVLFLLFLFMSSYLVATQDVFLFTLVQSFRKLELCKKLFVIVCTVMLQNYYKGKIVK